MPTINISNAIIEEISNERNNTFVTISYSSGRVSQTVRLVVGPRTLLRNMNGVPISANALRVGMTINAVISSAMTRSIPPQAAAYLISIVRNPRNDDITIGRILDIDRQNRNFTLIHDRNFSSIIRFNVSDNTLIFDRFGRRIGFSRLTAGRRVWVRHANFMTPSIPPQTTAFEIREL